MKSARTKACAISEEVKRKVYERDGGMCVICEINPGSPDMHYIPRSLGGLGTEQNVVCGCPDCHRNYDNGSQYNINFRSEGRRKIGEHLEHYYPSFSDYDRIYHKW